MTMKKIVCASLAAICVATSFASCGSKKDDEYLGKWQCEKIETEGKEVDNFFGVDAYALYQIELKEGNKGTVDSLFNTEGKAVDLEWSKEKDGKIKLVNKDAFEGEDVFLEKDGKKMVMSMDEEGEKVKIYLEKVDSFKEMPENPFADLMNGDDEDDSDFSFDDDSAEDDEE